MINVVTVDRGKRASCFRGPLSFRCFYSMSSISSVVRYRPRMDVISYKCAVGAPATLRVHTSVTLGTSIVRGATVRLVDSVGVVRSGVGPGGASYTLAVCFISNRRYV